ncbi:hypothetical protein EYF80_023928 [Liparis tanakae]|uniref:Uncharacterized protein n=1 Tax=Liparis tanakae TaxID=230148 RepID=A0A4Z2HIZ5_9TELE|nr:hypothetical protein EYF80_023928 [Liparis tanakae]
MDPMAAAAAAATAAWLANGASSGPRGSPRAEPSRSARSIGPTASAFTIEPGRVAMHHCIASSLRYASTENSSCVTMHYRTAAPGGEEGEKRAGFTAASSLAAGNMDGGWKERQD